MNFTYSTVFTPHFDKSFPNYKPQARSHLRSAGARPSHASFTARSSYLHLRGNSSPLGSNVTIPGHLMWHEKEGGVKIPCRDMNHLR